MNLSILSFFVFCLPFFLLLFFSAIYSAKLRKNIKFCAKTISIGKFQMPRIATLFARIIVKPDYATLPKEKKFEF
jgi:hypothetical protein